MSDTSETPADPTVGDTAEEPRDVDVFDNAEVHQVQDTASRPVARAADSGPPPTEARSPEDPLGLEEEAHGGTAADDPTAGVQISVADADEAVAGDEGPEHPGTR